MVRGRGIEGNPIDYFADVDWPFEPVIGAPVPVEYARRLAINLTQAIGERSIRDVAEAAGLDHATVAAILEGSRWTDMVTISKLEWALESRLWPEVM